MDTQIVTRSPAPVKSPKTYTGADLLPCPGKTTDETPAARALRLRFWAWAADLAIRPDAEPRTYWVQSEAHSDEEYRVQWEPGYPAGFVCDCPYASRIAGRVCKHIMAVTPLDLTTCPVCGDEAWVYPYGAIGACLCPVCGFRADFTLQETAAALETCQGWTDTPVPLTALLRGVYARLLVPTISAQEAVARKARAVAAAADLYGMGA